MTATNHGLFGAAIAIVLHRQPAVALAIAPFSHFLLDAIPHYGGLSGAEIKTKSFFTMLGLDSAIAVITTLLMAWLWSAKGINPILLITCAFLAASPDLMWAYYQYAGRKYLHRHWLPRFHAWVQWCEVNSPLGYITEVVWFVTLLSGLIYLGLK